MSVKWQPHCLGLKVLKHRGSLFEWVRFQSYFYLGWVWIQFGAIWINLKTLSVKWQSHCLGLNVLTYCRQFLAVSIWQSTLPNQFPNLGAMWIKYYFYTIAWRMAAIFLGLNLLTNCCWSRIASICRRHLNIYFLICFTFAHAIVIHKNEFEIVVCKISAIVSLPGCGNTLWQRQSDLYFEDGIFKFISNLRWNLNRI